MCWRSALPLILIAGAASAAEDYIVGLGAEADSADGLAGSIAGGFGIGSDTWLSAAVATNRVELSRGRVLDTLYADLGVDQWFDPVGVRVAAAYWGDSDILESRDWIASVYTRSDRFTLAGDFEHRDFRFFLPETEFFPARTIDFDARGLGVTARVQVTDRTSLALSAMDYDYDVNLRIDSNRRLLELLTFSRFSLINSLVDYRANIEVGVDVGDSHWQLDLSRSKGEVDGGRSRSATLRFLTPVGAASDIEFGLGVDDSDLYGTVTFFSVFLFFYGGSTP